MTLTDRLNRDPEVWKPSTVGDSIEGTLLDIERRESDYKNPDGTSREYPVLTIESDDGTEWVWFASQTGAKSQIERLNPQPGERVGASFRGEGDAKPGQNPPKRFRFLVERTPGTQPVEKREPAPATSGQLGPDDDLPF